jgi:hypothetical protein
VTSSPCAKFVSPVVPKISDSPTEHIAMIRPSRVPSTLRCASFEKKPLDAAWPSPVK